MKVKINAVDRLLLPQLLPQTESILIQTIACDIGRKIELTERDRKAIELKPSPQGQGVTWSAKKVSETEMEIEFSDAEIRMLQGQIKKLDEAKKVSMSMLNTVVKIQDLKLKTK